ncbi:hypothetical protein E2986_00970 [Frieseomelitta varia]|uniref:Uncharacterized protein n=1 Tax=Frieseomelitta varia TaxID=561572 RepID=A0A833W616_9HYME|nr:hypothetical protein E2986_00970 [Frieseomelitta varia]
MSEIEETRRLSAMPTIPVEGSMKRKGRKEKRRGETKQIDNGVFVCFQERSVLPKYYTRVPTVARSVTNSSGINLDCSSNTTLATNASPFNSQTALIAEKTVVVSSNNSVTTPSNHYYAQNLRNNHQKALNGSRIYDPLDRGLDHDYKQLDPLLVGEPPYTGVEITKPSMSSQNVKPTKDSVPVLHTQFEKEPKLSIMRFANQVTHRSFLSSRVHIDFLPI